MTLWMIWNVPHFTRDILKIHKVTGWKEVWTSDWSKHLSELLLVCVRVNSKQTRTFMRDIRVRESGMSRARLAFHEFFCRLYDK